MGISFRRPRKVRFGECDPAGIAYYPKLVEAVNDTVEDWFETAIGFSFRQMHLEENIGVPTRSIDVEFENPARLGDVLDWSLHVLKLGRSSIDLEITAHGPTGVRIIVAKPSLIWCDFSTGAPQSTEIPANIRNEMTAFFRTEEA